jgi:alpha-tubulin suppressor-like RCC1 family protein
MFLGHPKGIRVVQVTGAEEMEFLAQRRTAGWSSRWSALVLVAIVAALTLVIAGSAAAAPLPTVTKVEPNTGPAAGGTLVTITGTNFMEDPEQTVVKFGSAEAHHIFRMTETSITVTAQSGTVGTVDVTVTTPAGTSPANPADQFTYEPALAPSKEVMAWGNGEYGQLGNGDGEESDVPVPVSGLSEVTAIAAGARNSLALLRNGTVDAWGGNSLGQFPPEICSGNLPYHGCSRTPIEVPGLTGVTAISASLGGEYSRLGLGQSPLALLRNGTVMAWGSNGQGQLGDGTTTGSDGPVAVSGLSGVTAIAAGDGVSTALLKDGTVMDWGYNGSGELGDGTTINSDVPVAVSGLSGAKAIGESTALLRNGTVMDWGWNYEGQLGDGTTTGPETCEGVPCSRVPVAVSGLSEVTAIAAGENHSLALLRNGTVMAWGSNFRGLLGEGTPSGYSDVPVPVSGLSEVTAIAAGTIHNLALLRNGTVMAWGSNFHGELGDGTTTGSDVPVAVSGLSGVTGIAAGAEDSLAYIPPAPPPTVKKIKPNKGSADGDTTVTISGTRFTGATAVKFGSTDAASFTVNSETSITAVSPAGTPGTVDVSVTTPGGTSAISEHDHFKFLDRRLRRRGGRSR